MRPELPILIVEDDMVDLMTIKRAFKEVGMTNAFHHAANGEEALRFLNNNKSHRPGLILLDLNMPIMNGIEFLKEAKNDDAFKVIPVVVLTTSKDETDKLESYKNGIAGYMVKPLDYNEFVSLVRTVHSYWSVSEAPPV